MARGRLFLLFSFLAMLTVRYLLRVLGKDASAFDWFALAVSLVAELVVILLITYEIRTPAREKKARAKLLKNTFTLAFPSGNKATSGPTIGQGIPFTVYFSHPTLVRKFSIRLVDSGSSLDGGMERVSTETPLIHRLYDMRGELFAERDSGGVGHTAQWVTPRMYYAGDHMVISIEVRATVPWSGYLICEGFDADDVRQYANHPFQVQSTGRLHPLLL